VTVTKVSEPMKA